MQQALQQEPLWQTKGGRAHLRYTSAASVSSSAAAADSSRPQPDDGFPEPLSPSPSPSRQPHEEARARGEEAAGTDKGRVPTLELRLPPPNGRLPGGHCSTSAGVEEEEEDGELLLLLRFDLRSGRLLLSAGPLISYLEGGLQQVGAFVCWRGHASAGGCMCL